MNIIDTMNRTIYVGYPGFPKGFAQVQRQMLIAKGLAEKGCTVLVLSRYGNHEKKTNSWIKPKGVYNNVEYKFCSGNPFRSESFLIRNILKIKGFFIEFLTIIRQKKKHNANILLITTNTFRGIVYYTLLAKILGLYSVVDQVEYWSAHKKGLKKRIDSYFNDNYYGFFPDKAIVISNYLREKLKKQNPNIPVIKIPAICDFSKFSNNSIKKNEAYYFLFCGSANYFEIIKFILDSFNMLKSNTHLVLVISGNKQWIDRVTKYININNIKKVFIQSNIPYNDLIFLYENSLALLIPIRPNLQDISRFPHKLGEYTASKRPIISTDLGEVSVYFKDGENAFLSNEYNKTKFSNKMQEVIEYPEKREKIAIHSYETGIREFDYQKNTSRLYEFLFNN